MDETANVQENLDWINAVQVKLEQSRPRATEIQPLAEEVMLFQVSSDTPGTLFVSSDQTLHLPSAM